MNRHAGVIITILICLSGCASLRVQEGVANNIVHSSNPRFTIKINSEFEYLGHIKNRTSVTSTSGTELWVDQQAFIFIIPSPKKGEVEKLLSVEFNQIESHFVSDFFVNVKNRLESGITEIGGKNYQYYIKVSYPGLGAYITKYIYEQGYTLPCSLVKTIGRVEGPSGDVLIKFNYYDFVSFNKAGFSCQSLKGETYYWAEEFLEEFKRGFRTSFEILTPER